MTGIHAGLAPAATPTQSHTLSEMTTRYWAPFTHPSLALSASCWGCRTSGTRAAQRVCEVAVALAPCPQRPLVDCFWCGCLAHQHTCSNAARAELHAITYPELRYWLTTNQSAGAGLAPGKGNTVFVLPEKPGAGLELEPPTGPNRDSRGPDAGGLVKPQPTKGWSLADVQVRTCVLGLQLLARP